MGSPSRNVQYHPPRLSEDRLNLPQPHSPSLPTHCTAPGNRECALSNWDLGQTPAGLPVDDDNRTGQPFTTGTDAYYEMTSVDVVYTVVVNVHSDNDVGAAVHTANSSGNPVDKVFDLSTTATFVADGTKTFTAPANSRLEAGTRYVIVFRRTGGSGDDNAGHLLFGPGTGLDANDDTEGWSIQRGRLHRGGTWRQGPFDRALRMRLKGKIFPAPGKPEDLSARAIAPTRIALEWTGITGEEGFLGYRIERSDDGNDPWTSIVNTRNQEGTFDYWRVDYGPNYNDNTAEPGETYHYRVRGGE